MYSRANWSTRLLQCVIAAVIACTGIVAHAQSGSFLLQNPAPSPTWLTDIQYVGGSLYVVGDQTTISKSLDGGQTWAQQSGDANAMTEYRSVYFQSAQRGWAVGGWQRIRPNDTLKQGVIEWTNDGGATWAREIVQQSTMINDVFFTSATQGYAVGRGREALQPFSQEKPFTYITVDNGQTWTRQTSDIDLEYGYEMKSVVFANNSTGYMIAGSQSSGPGVYDQGSMMGTQILTTMNSGTNWSYDGGFNLGATVSQVIPLSLTRAYACGNLSGYASLFYTSDNGNSWIQQTNGFPTNIQGHVTSIVFPTANVGYAIGYKYVTGGRNLLVMKTMDGGSTWNEMDRHFSLSNIDGSPWRVTAADAKRLWICGRGSAGFVLYSGDGADSWTLRSNNVAALGKEDPTLNGVSFADQMNGWAVGMTADAVTERFVPVVVHTSNGGALWTPQGMSSSFGRLSGVAAISPNEAWVGGANMNNTLAVLYHTIDGGATWTNMPTGSMGPIKDIAFSNLYPKYGVIVAQDNVYYTNNGGQTWQISATGGSGNNHVGSFYGNEAWIVNSNYLLHSVDTGKTWTTIPNSAFGTYSSRTLEGVSFIPAGQYGWVTGWEIPGGDEGSGDGGSGNNRTTAAVVSTLPQPFIGYTTDNGNTWMHQSNFQISNPVYPCSGCPKWIPDQQYIFNDVHDVIAAAPNAAIAVTNLNANAAGWDASTAGTGTRLIATTDAGATWNELDSSYQGTMYSRLSGTLTNRIDAFGVGMQGMIRHGFLNVPLVATSPDTLFKSRVLSFSPTDSADEKIMVRNIGSSPLTVNNLVITAASGADNSNPQNDYAIVSAPTTLNPGDTGYIVVRFKPSQFSPRFATLTITTNSVATPVRVVGLRGSGGLAIVRAYPNSLFRDTVAIDGGFEDQAVYICNPGVTGVHADLHVGTPFLIDSTNGNNYTIIYAPAASIPPGVCDSVVVRFRPTSGGPKRGSVTIPSNARDFPNFTASLGGVGGVRTITQDTLRQGFADTVLCSGTSKCFVISNTGTLPIRVDSVVVAGAGKSEFSVSHPLGATIASGKRDSICVTHSATKFGTANANLIIYSNALNAPKDTLRLTGLGLQGFLALSPRVIKDTIPCQQTFDTTITMRDTGNITVHVIPEIGNLPAGWELILPFQQDVDSNATFRVRHDVSNVKKWDTLHLSLTWNNKGNCGPVRHDTLTFIYYINCLTSVRENIIAREFALFQNYPNPFNPSTSIEYAIPSRSNVTLKVFNTLGEAVRVLENTMMEPGTYKSTFDATDLPSGNYYYELTAGTYTKRMLMTLTK